MSELSIVAKRLRELRKGVKLSQEKMGEVVGVKQSSLNRYENGTAEPSIAVLTCYADYFDVSLDYIFGRTDCPQGKVYECHVRLSETDPEIEKFVEMCFDPKSPMSERLKATLIRMLQESMNKKRLTVDKA